MLSFLREVSQNQVLMWVCDDKIKIEAKGENPPYQLINKIKQQKSEILSFLSEKNIFSKEMFKNLVLDESGSNAVDQSLNTGKGQKVEAIYPATSLQQGFVYHHLSQPHDDAYRVQLLLDYHQAIDIDMYIKAWSLTSLRFPVLRTAFDWEGDIWQIITSGASIDAANFTLKDLSGLPAGQRDDAIAEIQRQDRAIGFDLSQPGLIRFTLIKQHEQLVTVLKTMHHSISDGWSGPILWQTVHDYYERLRQGQIPHVVAETAYLATQQYHLTHKAEADAFWAQEKACYQGGNDI
uniref:condensation domain-containing protein n=1 Tax=Xenorhabdus vietnamensis TaxID=351656 RepID=UPI001FC91668